MFLEKFPMNRPLRSLILPLGFTLLIAGCQPANNPNGNAGTGSAGKQLTVAMMPKSKGNAYFVGCRKGAEQAAKDLNVKLLWDGPSTTDPAKQNEYVDTWITRGVDVIAVAAENREGISTVLRKAQEKGIKVMTWDADALPDARSFFVNQATPRGIAVTLVDHAARLLNGKGEFGITTAGEFKEGQKSVIGKTSGGDEDTAVFVVIELKVLN